MYQNIYSYPKIVAFERLIVEFLIELVAPFLHMLVVADYSQLELRVMAAIAKDFVMSEAYRNGLDLHAVTAAGMLGIKPVEFDPDNPAHKAARQKAKAVNFGSFTAPDLTACGSSRVTPTVSR